MQIDQTVKTLLATTGDLETRLKAAAKGLEGGLCAEELRQVFLDSVRDVGLLQGSLLTLRDLWPPPCS